MNEIDVSDYANDHTDIEIRIENDISKQTETNIKNINNRSNPIKIEDQCSFSGLKVNEFEGKKKSVTDKNDKKNKKIVNDSDEDYTINLDDHHIDKDIDDDFKENKKKSNQSNKTKSKEGFNNNLENNENLQNLNTFSNPHNGLPDFLKSDNIRDKMRRRPDDANYDPTTLYVPDAYLKSKDCTPVMQQYWQFKIDNFDKVLLFKLGKFYEMFYDDAIVGNQVLDLNWMGNDPKKLHVGFPEKCLEEKASRLIESGFKVSVVEQIERPEELKERVKGQSGVKDKVVKRELCNVFTKGTYINSNGLNYSNKFCLTLICNMQSTSSHHSSQISSQKKINESKYIWGFIIFDVTTLKFFIGQISEEEENFNKIMTLLYNIRPEEVIIIRNNIPHYILNFILSLSSKPQITYLKNDYNLLLLNKLCTKYLGDDLDKWDKLILDKITDEDNNRNVCYAIYNTINYLEKILLADQCLRVGSFEEYCLSNMEKLKERKSLIIDYQAITNLELIETKIDPKNIESGSLLEYVNRCVTQFGKRMMRNWLLNPLAIIEDINDRLDMVEDFNDNPELLTSFRTALSKWPDIERQCSKIYKFAINTNSKAVYFEDVSKNRLQEFFNLINFITKSMDIFKLFEPYYERLRSNKLLKKVSINYSDKDINKQNNSFSNCVGCVPDIKKELEHFSHNFIIRNEIDDNKNNVLIVNPIEGVYSEYDNCKQDILEIESKLDEILKKERKRMKCPIQFAHTKHNKYELEIPEECVNGNKRPSDYTLTTSKKGFLRFHTQEILSLVEDLENAELKLKEETKKFNYILFKDFYSKSFILNEYIKNMAELDCIANLAIVSTQSEGEMVRPVFISKTENGGLPYLRLEKSRHPCLSTRSSNFVPNDITIGKKNKSSIVITGPNMGGKSTLLRQTCVCVIMAQIGCYVPAQKCELTVVDRIFTRIGARDKILEGKSTFYIEMEETKTIMSQATIDSLVIMDELGRGTSTYDGMIIAKTILDRLEKKLKCRTLFTTHYHNLKDWCLSQPGIDLYFMDCVVSENSKDITFLYKFKQGVCPQSYGIHVAKLAGLPEIIINMAAKVSENFRKNKSINI